MTWQIEWDARAVKELRKIGSSEQQQIKKYLKQLSQLSDPKLRGKPLVGTLAQLWRYRVRNYRIICQLESKTLTILVLRIGHRSKIYQKVSS